MQNHRSTTTVGRRALGMVWLCVAAAAWLGPTTARAEETPVAAVTSRPTLYLTNGGFVGGELKDCDQPGRLRWQGSFFTAPFDFLPNDVNAVHFPPPATLPRPSGDYCFELSAGDVLFGSLVNLDDSSLEIEAARLGRIHVLRSAIRRIYRWRDSADLIYLGPNGLTGWNEVSAKKGWREESGQLFSDQAGATIQGSFQLPARAAIEIEISWK